MKQGSRDILEFAPNQAPTTPLSTQTGITTASSVTSPSSSNPPPSNSASNVTTPTTGVSSPSQTPQASPSNPSQPAVNPAPTNQTPSVSSPAVGTTNQTPAANPSNPSTPATNQVSSPAVGVTTQTPANPATNPSTPNKPVSSPAIGTTQTPLQAPSQAAPTGVTTTASSVSSPSGSSNAPSTTASNVTSPNASNQPPSSNLPSASSVSSPSSSKPPVSSVSSVTPPVSSVKPVGVTVKPLDLTDDQEKGVKKILQDIYGPAMSLSAIAELTEEAAKKLLGEIEERSRQAAEDQLASMFQRGGMSATDARLQAKNDMVAVQTYQDARSMTPEQRIEMNTNIAVGVYTGATKPEEWKESREKIRLTNTKFADCSQANGKEFCKDQFALGRSSYGLAANDPRRFNGLDWSRNQLGKESRDLIKGASTSAYRHIEKAKCVRRALDITASGGGSFALGVGFAGVAGQGSMMGAAIFQGGVPYLVLYAEGGFAIGGPGFSYSAVPWSFGSSQGSQFNGPVLIFGAWAGVGVSVGIGNATVNGLTGAFDKFNADVGLGFSAGGSLSAGQDSSGLLLTGSRGAAKIGEGIGFQLSQYPTNTVKLLAIPIDSIC
jgi:hypothetical protein